MKRYIVEYKEHSAGNVKSISVEARNKAEAYDKVVYSQLNPYSAWIDRVEYSNGKVKTFNNFEGNPY